MLVLGLPVQLKRILKKPHGKRWFPTNICLVNRLQSENKRPINSQMKYFFQGRMYSCYTGKSWTYYKSGWYWKVWQSIILWYMTFRLLVNIWSMPRGLWHNCKVNDNVKQPGELLIGQCEHNTFKTFWEKLQNLFQMKLATDVTLLFLSVADSDMFVYFFMSQV